jgi:hypothetical protein
LYLKSAISTEWMPLIHSTNTIRAAPAVSYPQNTL